MALGSDLTGVWRGGRKERTDTHLQKNRTRWALCSYRDAQAAAQKRSAFIYTAEQGSGLIVLRGMKRQI